MFQKTRKIIMNILKKGMSHTFELSLSKNKNYTKTLLCVRVGGSITAEAALVVPVFVLFLVLFLGIFRIQQVELQVNQALSYTATVLSMDTEMELIKSLRAKSIFIQQLEVEECRESYIKGGWQQMELTLADSDADYVRANVNYEICLPVNLFGKQYVEVNQYAVARRWAGNKSDEDQENSWVYITPFGTAYHKVSSCRYLDLSIWGVTKVQIATLRNKSDGKYKACSVCDAATASGETIVYVTDYGNLYHKSLECRNLKRTVYRVSVDAVSGRSPCQKCYGEE